jgi:hypothetical protein
MSYLGDRPKGFPQIEPPIMRMLNTGRDFSAERAPTLYLENHDHKRFMLKAGGRDYWNLTQPYIIALFTCAGAPLIFNGQEFGLDNDMPESGDGRAVPRPLDWTLQDIEPGPTIFVRYQQMMKIRRDHPVLGASNFYPSDWKDEWTKFDENGYGIDRDRNLVVYHRWGVNTGNNLERFYIVLNFSQQLLRDVSFVVPDSGPWQDLISGKVISAQSDDRLHIDIDPNSGAIYYKKWELD